jgi:hypothetical protein
MGWQMVISGELPLTQLGRISYLIGRALNDAPDDPLISEALDILSSIFILHIATLRDSRWISTAAIFDYALSQLEGRTGRKLSSVEIRYLSAATFNTLDSNDAALLLAPYEHGSQIERMLFVLESGDVNYFAFEDFPNIVDHEIYSVNSFQKTKAALFWANPLRGIFTRGHRGIGGRLLREYGSVESHLLRAGLGTPLSDLYEILENGGVNPGIFAIAGSAFSAHPGLLDCWASVEGRLFEIAGQIADGVDADAVPAVWFDVQRLFREDAGGAEGSRPSVSGSVSAGMPLAGGHGPRVDAGKSDIPFKVDPPASRADIPRGIRAPRVVPSGRLAGDLEARLLGEAGEEFVLNYERQRLTLAGRPDLAEQVVWASKTIGDGLGYDIRSFEASGDPLYIEVKTTGRDKATPFFISANEVVKSSSLGDGYRLYRVFNFPHAPQFFELSGDMAEILQLSPVSYLARV